MSITRLLAAIEKNDAEELNRCVDELDIAPCTEISINDEKYNLIELLLNECNYNLLKHIISKEVFKTSPIPKDLICHVLACEPEIRKEMLQWLLDNHLSSLYEHERITKEHLLAALGDTSVLTGHAKDQPKDIYHQTYLHYAAISGYGITKDKVILEKINANDRYVIENSKNRGLSFQMILATTDQFETLDDLLDFDPKHEIYFDACIENINSDLFKADLFYFLAKSKQWDLIRKILTNNKNVKVDILLQPGKTNVTMLQMALEAKQWDLACEFLKRDKSSFLFSKDCIDGLPLLEYLKKHDQTILIDILLIRQDLERTKIKNAAEELILKRQLKNALSEQLFVLIKKGDAKLSEIDELIAKGADPNASIGAPKNNMIKAALDAFRIDILKHLIEKHGVKVSICVPNIVTQALYLPIHLRKELLCWLLNNEKYWKDAAQFNRQHILAALGLYPLEVKDSNSPMDNVGFNYYHYTLMSGIECCKNPEPLIKTIEAIPISEDMFKSAKDLGGNCLLWLSIINKHDRLKFILEKLPKRKFNYNAKFGNAIWVDYREATLLYDLAEKRKWDLLRDLYERSRYPVMNSIGPQNKIRRYPIKLSLLLAEGDIALFEEIARDNVTEFNNLNEGFPQNQQYEGITLALLLAYHKKWDLLKFLFESNLELQVNLGARAKEKTKYGTRSLREILQKYKQDELLKKFEGANQSNRVVKKITTKDKPNSSLKPKPVEINQPLTQLSKQEKIEGKLKILLNDAYTHLTYQYEKENKKVKIKFTFKGDMATATKKELEDYHNQKEKLFSRLKASKELKGNETILIDENNNVCGSEGALLSFFEHRKVSAILKNGNQTTVVGNTSFGTNLGDKEAAKPLDILQQKQWQDALIPAFCHAKIPNEIQWVEEGNYFKINIKPGPWRIRNHKDPHNKAIIRELNREFIKDNIISKLELALNKRKQGDDTPIYGQVEFDGETLKITPYIEVIPLLTELNRKLYKKIINIEQKITETSAILDKDKRTSTSHKTGQTPVTEHAGKELESANDKSEIPNSSDINFDLNSDNLFTILEMIAKNTEFKFLTAATSYHNEDNKLIKLVYKYNYTGAATINNQDSRKLLLALAASLDTIAPGFMTVHQNKVPKIKIVFNFTKMKTITAVDLKKMQDTFTMESTRTDKNPMLLSENKPLAENLHDELNLSNAPKQRKNKKKKKKKIQSEITESDVFDKIKGSVIHLSDNKKSNIEYHLNELKLLTKSETNERQDFFDFIRLLHCMRILGILGSGTDEENLYYTFRNILRHAVDEMEHDTSCAHLCEKVTPFLNTLRKHFGPATITNVSVSLFSATKCTVMQELKDAIAPFQKNLNDKTVGENKHTDACLNLYRILLDDVAHYQFSSDSELNYKWKRDATLILCSLIEEIVRDDTYGEIYRKVGHEFEEHYEVFADSLYQDYIDKTFQSQPRCRA